MNQPKPPNLTSTERLALNRLGTNPETATTRVEFAKILDMSTVNAGSILNRLVDKGYVSRTSEKRGTRFWRRGLPPECAEIKPGSSLDQSIANLQAQAARAETLELALHQILNILTDLGLDPPGLPLLKKQAE